MRRVIIAIFAVSAFFIFREAIGQQSTSLLSLQYELNESNTPGLFSNPSRAAGVYFYSGSDFIKSAFTVDQNDGTLTYLIAKNDVLTFAGVYGDGSGEVSFNSPEGVDVDAAGNIYVADTGNNQIVRLNMNFNNGVIAYVSTISGIANPVDVVITNGTFWVLSESQSQVSEYSSSGSLLYSLGGSGSGNGQFSSPRGISARFFNGGISSSDIYVADTGNDRVVMFTKGSSSGTYSAWYAIPIANSSLSDVASDPDGNAYVMDQGQGRLHVAGWFGKDYLGYSSESFNQPRNVNFAPGYYELGTIEAWTTGSGVSQYAVGVEILNLSANVGSANITFSYILIANASMTGEVKNSSGQVIKNLVTNAGLPAYANQQHVWDRTDNNGNSVPDGQYTFVLTASTSHGQHTSSVSFSLSGGGGGDTTPPVISSVSAGNISSSGATITWTTDESSDSQVEYGLTTSYGNTTSLNTSLVISHSVSLSALSASTLYHYRVKSKDASGNLAVSGDFTFTTSSGGGGGGGNIAPLATASASSQNVNQGQTANKAIDGVVGGWPGDPTKEWASDNESNGAWLQLNFSQSYSIDKVVLYDRPNVYTQVLGAQLTFSSGSPVNVGALNNAGAAATVTFSARTITWLRFTVTNSAGDDLGLAEIEVFDSGGGGGGGDTTPPVISSVSAGNISSSGATITWTTDESSDSQVEYGLTTSYGNTTSLNTSLVISHSVSLSGLNASTLYHYRVKSNDASGNLAVSGDFTFTTSSGGGGGGGGNIAPLATASASSQNVNQGQTADKAIDGVVDGWPGDPTKEWASVNESNGAWLQLNFSQSYSVDKVVLYDRPNNSTQVLGAQLTFSSGSPVNVGALNNAGAAVTVTFSSRTITWIRFTVTNSAGDDLGLAEMEVFDSGGGGGGDTTPPVISSVSAGNISSSGATITWTTDESSDSQVEYGLTTSYGNTTSLNTSLVISHSVSLSALSASTLYHYRVKSKDASGNLAVSGDFTFTTSSGGGGGGGNIASLATASASSENVNHSQTADKAIDGVVDGWPGDYTKEWASLNESNGAWLQLDFAQSYSIDKVVLYDRPNNSTQVLGAQLTFSSGSPVNVGTLNNAGAGLTVTFSARTITWIRFTVTNSAGTNLGLAEMEVWQASSAPSQNRATAGENAPQQNSLPRAFSLSPPYPNPFNAETVFHLDLPAPGHVAAVIYDLAGHEIKRIYNEMMPPGRQALRWDGKNQAGSAVGTGVYLLRVEYVGNAGWRETAMRKVVLMK